MPDGIANVAPETLDPALASPELHAALAAANTLIGYAAANGQLQPPAPAAAAVISDIIHAQQAEQANTLTADIVVAFWTAYAQLSSAVKPVTADSLAASNRVSLTAMKAGAVALVSGIIIMSIFLFMSNATASDTADLIEQQNAAALHLWSDLQLLRPSASTDPASPDRTIQTERVFEELVEFSRRSNALLQDASRLNYWFIPPWLRLSPDSVRFEPGQPIDHINVSPHLTTWQGVEQEGASQIEAYQAIRNYAVALSKMETLLYGSLATYFLPVVYALLGAFLYGFRMYSRLIRRKMFLETAAHSARYFIAAIAGLVIGLFGSLLPKSLALPPLAVAFLMGYAVEAFFSRLDVAIAKLKGGAETTTAPADPGAAEPAAA